MVLSQKGQISSPHQTHQHQLQQQQQSQQHSPHQQQQQALQQSPQYHLSSPGPIASQTPPRATPTVIMGESCGVRTMVWSYDTTLQQVHNTGSSNGGGNTNTDSAPGLSTVSGNVPGNNLGMHHQLPHQQQLTKHQHSQKQQNAAVSVSHHQQGHPHQTNGGIANFGNSGIGGITSNSGHNNVSPSNNNEEAAHLLLSLGQSVIPTTSPSAAAAAVAAAAAAVVAGQTQAWQGTNHARTNIPLNMERLWAGDYAQFSSVGSQQQQQQQQQQALNLTSQQQQQQQHNLSWSLSGIGSGSGPKKEMLDDMPPEEDDQPLVCMICEDKATGLHYGIITCEGCKGFFKRTVQNRRVYTCVADGTCEITKAQRNRCQYCRFKKCIEQGMVLQAVREDRMPGGRNSGAVYNLYKVKYKKHKKNNQKSTNAKLQQGAAAIGTAITNLSDIGVGAGGPLGGSIASVGNAEGSKSTNAYHHAHVSTHLQQHHHLPSTTSPTMVKSESMNLNLMNGTILKTALTNPSEIVHLRHRLDNAVSSSKDRSISYEQALNMIHTLIDCDAMEDIATLPHFSEFLADKSEIGDKLCNIGDSIVHKLVSWTRKLPFYTDIPVEIHTKLLTDKWHEILVLTTAAYQAMHGKKNISTAQTQSGGMVLAPDKNDPEFTEEITCHLHTLQSCLTTLMGHPITIEQLKIDVGQMVEKMTQITIMFRRIKLKMEEYVCLKVYILLNTEVELESIQERYIQVLRSYLQHTVPHNPNRLNDLLAHIPEIQTAASLLLESKMFYVPFVLNSANIR
uniref:Hormone receptor 4 n=1 Tax=Anopheles epiroticus TaxID=199890 RepID=A0A182PMS3_9DIPT